MNSLDLSNKIQLLEHKRRINLELLKFEKECLSRYYIQDAAYRDNLAIKECNKKIESLEQSIRQINNKLLNLCEEYAT